MSTQEELEELLIVEWEAAQVNIAAIAERIQTLKVNGAAKEEIGAVVEELKSAKAAFSALVRFFTRVGVGLTRDCLGKVSFPPRQVRDRSGSFREPFDSPLLHLPLV